MIVIELSPNTRLGNWLFQYAAAKNLSSEVGFFGNFPGWRDRVEQYREYFRDAKVVDGIDGMPVYKERGFTYQAIEYKGKDLVLWGLFQSYKYFDKSLAQKLYEPSAEMVSHIKGKYGHWLSSPCVVGVSVRRGDYLKVPERHPFVGKEYIDTAMSRFKGAVFIFCSDDIPWCKRHFKGDNLVFVENESVAVQLYIHTMCQHNIISNSSFSWWGAYLNKNPKKLVIAPRPWFGVQLRHINVKDLFEGDVIFIDAHLPVLQKLRCVLNMFLYQMHCKFPHAYKIFRKVVLVSNNKFM